MSPKRSKAEVLLELLDRVKSADTLEILLKPENLLRLFLLYGGDPDSMKAQLARGKLPGEFLLEILDQEPNVSTLMLQLNPETRQHWWGAPDSDAG